MADANNYYQRPICSTLTRRLAQRRRTTLHIARRLSWQRAIQVCITSNLQIFAKLYPLGMNKMNISLPDGLTSFVDQQVAQGGYATSSECVRELIRQDQDRGKHLACRIGRR